MDFIPTNPQPSCQPCSVACQQLRNTGYNPPWPEALIACKACASNGISHDLNRGSIFIDPEISDPMVPPAIVSVWSGETTAEIVRSLIGSGRAKARVLGAQCQRELREQRRLQAQRDGKRAVFREADRECRRLESGVRGCPVHKSLGACRRGDVESMLKLDGPLAREGGGETCSWKKVQYARRLARDERDNAEAAVEKTRDRVMSLESYHRAAENAVEMLEKLTW